MSETPGKKTNPLVWVGIGCGGLLVVGIIAVALLVGMCKRKVDEISRDFQDNPAKTAAEWAVRANPDLELVSTDEAAGTITVRDKTNGQEVTVDFKDAAEGRFKVTSGGNTATFDGKTGAVTSEGPDGTMTLNTGGLEKMPAWFEVPGGINPWRSLSHREQGGRIEGMVVGDSTETAEDLAAAFAAALEAAGFTQVSKLEQHRTLTLNYRNDLKKQVIGVVIVDGGKGRSVTVTYVGE